MKVPATVFDDHVASGKPVSGRRGKVSWINAEELAWAVWNPKVLDFVCEMYSQTGCPVLVCPSVCATCM